MENRLFFLRFLFLLLIPLQVQSQALQFFREKIEITVQGNAAMVTGTYYFKNRSMYAQNVLLFYPIVVNDSLPPPDSIAVFDGLQKKSISYSSGKKGIHFFIRLPGKSIRVYRVVYRQSTPYRLMEYILITTRRWGRPLKRAEYILKLPANLTLTEASLPFHLKSLDMAFAFYYYTVDNFLPEKNLYIKWQRRTK